MLNNPYNYLMAAALFGTGFAIGKITEAKAATTAEDFVSIELGEDGMVSVTINGEEVANVWRDHRDRVEVEFPKSLVEVHEAFDTQHTPYERVKVSTLTLRNDAFQRELMGDDQFIPLDGFDDDPDYDDLFDDEEFDEFAEMMEQEGI